VDYSDSAKTPRGGWIENAMIGFGITKIETGKASYIGQRRHATLPDKANSNSYGDCTSHGYINKCVREMAQAQETPSNPVSRGPISQPELTRRSVDQPVVNQPIPLTVPEGIPIQVALDNEVRIKEVGQAIHGHVIDPVYAFDQLVIPVAPKHLARLRRSMVFLAESAPKRLWTLISHLRVKFKSSSTNSYYQMANISP